MAENINLRQAEYQTVVSELQSMHTDQIETVTAILKELRTLATDQDGLSADATSAKIADVVDSISEDVVKFLERVFADSEAGILSMMTAAMAVDTACN